MNESGRQRAVGKGGGGHSTSGLMGKEQYNKTETGRRT